MPIPGDLRDLTPNQRNAVLASFLGWTLDAFDFFIIVFVLKDIAKEFKTDIPSVTATLFLTLAMRPLGAFLFGMMADRFGRRPTLMIDIMFYSVVEFLSGFAPSLTALVILRALYGIAMGGEWGVGASLTMETIPPKTRGIVSGLLQALPLPRGIFFLDGCDHRPTRTDILRLPQRGGNGFKKQVVEELTGLKSEDFQGLLTDRSSAIGKNTDPRIKYLRISAQSRSSFA